MRLGELLVGQGLITTADVAAAQQRQQREGGRLGNHFVAMGVLTISDLVTALRGLREVGSALRMSARAYQRWRTVRGPDHPETYRARLRYARALLAAGRPSDSLNHAATALAGLRTHLGDDHAWTGEARQVVADAHHAVSANEPHSTVAGLEA